MKVNGIEIDAKEFAYEGCHKIYLIEDEKDKKDAIECGYDIYPIAELEDIYNNSCELRFINNWQLTKNFVGQFEKAIFEK